MKKCDLKTITICCISIYYISMKKTAFKNYILKTGFQKLYYTILNHLLFISI